MAQMGFYINSAVCSGCKACELACKDRNNLDVGARLRKVRQVSDGTWDHDPALGTYTPKGVFSYSISFSCGHCESPACVASCPTGAMAKDTDTGIVSNDPDVCIGCGACAKACPYGAPAVVETLGIAKKCDMCKNLIDIGEAPACVEICPQRVLEYDTYDNLVAKHDGLKDVAPLPDSATTGPCVVITPHADAVYDSGQCRPMHLEEQ